MLTLAILVGAVAAGTVVAGPRRRVGFVREAGIILGGYALYFLVRGLTEGGVARASENAMRLVELERSLGVYFERSLQQIALDSQAVVTLANWVYMWGHWPVIGVIAIWLYRSHPEQFVLTRNALLISGGLGLFFFALMPVAPPRLMDLGFEDTVVRWSGSYHVLQPPSLVNQYAAFPSLHLGWNVLVMMAMYQATVFAHMRAIAFIFPGAMFLAIVLTGNHFIVDGIGGVALCLFSLHLARRVSARDRSLETTAEFARVA